MNYYESKIKSRICYGVGASDFVVELGIEEIVVRIRLAERMLRE
jgi:hypothetical protein